MLDNVYTWYRIADPHATNEKIAKRKDAIVAWIEEVRAADSYDSLLQAVSIIAVGAGRPTSNHKETLDALATHIRTSEPDFPTDISAEYTSLRLCLATAIGEIVHSQKSPEAHAAATLIASSLTLRPKSSDVHMQKVLDSLVLLGDKAIAEISARVREREIGFLESVQELKQKTNASTTVEQLSSSVFTTLEKLARGMQADQEELEILWWLYRGQSETLCKPLKDLALSEAAICTGVELADRVSVPSPGTARGLIRKHLVDLFSTDANTASTWKKQISGWDTKTSELLLQTKEIKEYIRTFPELFPLSWICLRVQESNATADWEKEFASMTGFSPKDKFTAPELGRQAFYERVAQRVCL